jgi:hypothetical protein
MMAACRAIVVVGLLLLVGLAPLQALAAGEDPDWPCVQRLVPQIAPAAIWSGPPLDLVESAHHPAIDELAAELAVRRVPLDEAVPMIEAFASGLEAEANAASLTLLFARTLEIINRDRSSIIEGIRKFSRGQRALADRIADANSELRALPVDSVLERDALVMQRDWDARIFDERRTSLTYLCEQPVLLDQRAFALARAIAGHLE